MFQNEICIPHQLWNSDEDICVDLLQEIIGKIGIGIDQMVTLMNVSQLNGSNIQYPTRNLELIIDPFKT